MQGGACGNALPTKRGLQRLRARGAVWREENPEKNREFDRRWREENPEKKRECDRKWSGENPEKLCAKNAGRRARKLQATPAWASTTSIKALYDSRPEGHHVDHIVPLKHPLVCGLHVHQNLQHLLGKENLSKSNKFDPWTFEWWPDEGPGVAPRPISSNSI